MTVSVAYTRSQASLLGISERGWRHAPTIGELRGIRIRAPKSTQAACDDAPADPLPRVRAAGLLLAPGWAIGGWAAAVQHGIPTGWLDGRSADLTPLRVPFLVGAGAGRRSRRGVRAQASDLPPSDVVDVDGVRCTAGLRTAFDLVRFAPTDALALALGDAAYRFGLTTPGALRDFAEAHRGWRGLPRLRRVVGELTPYAESPRESELRWLWVALGLPQPLVNPNVCDRMGHFVGRCDLMDRQSGHVGEYNGHWHRLGEQHWADVQRERAFAELNCTVSMVGAPDFADWGRSAADVVLDGRKRAQDRDPSRDGWVVVPQTGPPRL